MTKELFSLGRNGIFIGAQQFPDRKKPSLCVERDGKLTICGSFRDKESAAMFLSSLSKFCNASSEGDMESEN